MNVSAREGEMEMAVKNPQEPFTRITVEEAAEMMSRQDVVFIDVREPHEYQRGHVPGARLIPVNSLFARREELPKDKEIVFVCAVGQRSALACEMAAAAGLTRIYNLEGGTEAWIKAGLPIEK
jgi:rhodanese-related sulfurtransferase